MWNYPLLFKTIFVILFIYLLYDFITNGKIRKKVGKKVLGISLILIVVFTISFVIAQPYIITRYKISKEIKTTPLNQYIESYKRTGYEGATLTLDVNESFENLSNKEKGDYVKELNSIVSSIIYHNFLLGEDLNKFSKFNEDNKVIINSGSDKYEFQNDILTLNEKEIYKFEAPKHDKTTDDAINNEMNNLPLTNDDETEIRVLTKKLVKDNLKNPSSAKFCGYNELHITKAKNGTYLATGWVEATNSFGAVLRNDFQVTFERRNGHMFGSDVQIFEN